MSSKRGHEQLKEYVQCSDGSGHKTSRVSSWKFSEIQDICVPVIAAKLAEKGANEAKSKAAASYRNLSLMHHIDSQ